MSKFNPSEESCCRPQEQGCCSGSEAQSHCESEECCCTAESVTEKWRHTLCEAMEATQVEILKKKIVEKWGDKMETVADAVIEATEAQWQAMKNKAQSQAALRETISKVFQT